MNKLQQRIRLLMLFSIYFIYRALASFYLENNPSMAAIWGIITITYIISYMGNYNNYLYNFSCDYDFCS